MNQVLLRLIISSLKIAFLSFGGGAAVIPLIHKEFIEKSKLVSEQEFNQLVILANTLPGPTILQLTTYIGYRAGSYLGAIVTFIIVLFPGPALLILGINSLKSYVTEENFLKLSLSIIPAVMGMLFSFTVSMLKQDLKVKYNWYIYFLIFALTLVLLLLNVSVILIFIGVIMFIILWNSVYRGKLND